MKPEYITFNKREDDIIKLVRENDSEYLIVLKKDIILDAYSYYMHTTDIEILPSKPIYQVYCIPDEDKDCELAITISELQTNQNKLNFVMYNMSDHQIIKDKGDTVGYISAAKSFLREDEQAYYTSNDLVIREKRKNVIKYINYCIDTHGSHSLIIKLNTRPFESDHAEEIPLKGDYRN